ncbi:MAG: glycosyltransferase [Pirellulales bacterium]
MKARPSVADTFLSVVMPVYNEAAVLHTLTDRVRDALAATGSRGEIVYVDDGSRDGSPRILDELAATYADVRAVHLSRNFGHQAAVQAGLCMPGATR